MVAYVNSFLKGDVEYYDYKNPFVRGTQLRLEENKGVGTALIYAVHSVAKARECKRLWLITTNDDIDAFRFYQIKGFEWIATHINAMEISRKIKPSIPLTGMYNISIKHELEFEMQL